MARRMFALAIRRVSEPHGRCRFVSSRTVIANVCPQTARLCLTVARFEYRDRHIVAMQFLRTQYVTLQCFHQRPHRPARAAHPVSHGRAVEFDAFARVDLRLAVERKMVCILGNQHMRQQPGTGETLVDRAMRRGFLQDARAAGATQFRPHRAYHLEARRNVFEHFRDVFAERTQRTAAVRASLLLRRDRFDFTRQFGG